MKRILTVTILAALFLATVAFVAGKAPLTKATATVLADEGRSCSLGSAAGKWGFTTNGTVVGIGPRDSLGIFTLDGAGNLVNGKATSSLNGSITGETFSGTYTVNPDCTGAIAIDIFDLSGNKILSGTLNTVFDNDVRELRAMYTSAILPNGTALGVVITGSGKRVFSAETSR